MNYVFCSYDMQSLLCVCFLVEECKRHVGKTLFLNIVLVGVRGDDMEKLCNFLLYLQYPFELFVVDVALTKNYTVRLFDETDLSRPDAVYIFCSLDDRYSKFIGSSTKFCFYGSPKLITCSQRKCLSSVYKMKVFTVAKNSWLLPNDVENGSFYEDIADNIPEEVLSCFESSGGNKSLICAQTMSIFFKHFALFIPCEYGLDGMIMPDTQSNFYLPLGLSHNFISEPLRDSLQSLKCVLRKNQQNL